MAQREYLIWIDLEMTGLMPDSDQIIEMATVVTDKNLNVTAEGPELAIHQPEEVLARMDAWNQRQHGGSGLLARVRSSRMSLAEAERQTLLFLSTGPALSGTADARARAVFSLSQSRCEHTQGTGASVDARIERLFQEVGPSRTR